MKRDDDEPDLFGGKEARDEGIERVMEGEYVWSAKVMAVIASLPRDWEGITEDIRLASLKRGLALPHHPNCWGALMNSCIRSGILIRTGEYRHLKVRHSHARNAPVYRRTATRFDPPDPLPMPMPVSPTMAAEEFTF